MTVRTFTFNPFATNGFVFHDGGEAVVVDPTCDTPAACAQVVSYVQREGLRVREILLTHAHIDHILGCRALSEAFGVGIRLHRDDAVLLERASMQAGLFGIELDEPPAPTGWLEEGEEVVVGAARWRVLHTPGHSPGSVTFYDAAAGVALAGDVLFRGSIGRTDLWGGSLPTLMQSIFGVLVPLGDSVTIHPGHGPATTIGDEVRSNPFLAG